MKWHEIKSAVIYRLEQQVKKEGGRGLLLERYILACPPETGPVDFGAAVQAEARRRGLGRAGSVYLVMDGAVWLWDLAEDRFASAIKTLDFHHASQHLWAVGHALHGEGTDQAKEWVEKLLHDRRQGQEARVVKRLEQLLESPTQRPAEVQKVVEKGSKLLSKTIVTIYITKRWPRLARPLAVGRSSPSGLNSKTDSEVVVGSGSDLALPICCG